MCTRSVSSLFFVSVAECKNKFQNIGGRQKQKKKNEKRERQLYKLYACTGIYIFFIIMPTFLPQIPTQLEKLLDM